MGKKLTLSQNQARIIDIPIEDLLLDSENPRFAEMDRAKSQRDLVKKLWEDTHLDELILSIAVNGYYRQEPLLVIKKNNKFIVVEGNRRLASVMILLDPVLAKYVRARVRDFPKMSKTLQTSLKKLPVIQYRNREELWTYLSFRHINGARSWSAISKAEFVADLHLRKRITFDEILRSTGDKNRTSIKLYNGLMVLRQAEKITRFTRDDFNAAKFNFSHLYTIIQYPITRKFLGIDRRDSSKPFPENSVPDNKKKELEELLIWIFGSRQMGVSSVIRSQNPDLRMLDDIIGNMDALTYLREKNNLDDAHEYTKQEDRRLESYIVKAEMNMRKAKSVEDSYKGDRVLAGKVGSIYEISGEMYKKMTKKVRK